MTEKDKCFTFILYFLNFRCIAQSATQPVSQNNNEFAVDIRKKEQGHTLL